VASAETPHALREALHLHLSTPCLDGVLRRALGQFSREAQANRACAEQVLTELRRVWGVLPEVNGAGSCADREELLARAVLLCVQEYYAGG
jgi:hypothetical protein